MNGNGHFDAWAYVWLTMAGLAGSIVSLSMRTWQRMTRGEIAMAVFVGTSFSLLGVPYLVVDVLKFDSFLTSIRVACGMTFFGAAFGFFLLPMLMQYIKKRAGFDTDEEPQA